MLKKVLAVSVARKVLDLAGKRLASVFLIFEGTAASMTKLLVFTSGLYLGTLAITAEEEVRRLNKIMPLIHLHQPVSH